LNNYYIIVNREQENHLKLISGGAGWSFYYE